MFQAINKIMIQNVFNAKIEVGLSLRPLEYLESPLASYIEYSIIIPIFIQILLRLHILL